MDFYASNQTKTDSPQWFDPLGPTTRKDANGKPIVDPKTGVALNDWAPTGGPEQRDAIFKYLSNIAPGLQSNSQNLSNRLQTASADPGFGTAAANANKTLSGGYLSGEPALNSALSSYQTGSNKNATDYMSGVGKVAQGVRSRAAAGAADSTANTASQFARAGQGLSTGNQQAAQASKAAAGAQADQTASQLQNSAAQTSAQMKETANQNVMGAKTQNYQAERARQAGGAEQLNSALGAPLNYLSQVPNAQLAPAQQTGQIVQGMSGGGPIGTPNSLVYKNAGIYDYLLSTLGAVSGGAGGGM